jgi:hypothetical protein
MTHSTTSPNTTSRTHNGVAKSNLRNSYAVLSHDGHPVVRSLALRALAWAETQYPLTAALGLKGTA